MASELVTPVEVGATQFAAASLRSLFFLRAAESRLLSSSLSLSLLATFVRDGRVACGVWRVACGVGKKEIGTPFLPSGWCPAGPLNETRQVVVRPLRAKTSLLLFLVFPHVFSVSESSYSRYNPHIFRK